MKHGLRIMKHTLWRRELRGAALALVAIAMLLATANAGCGDPRGAKPTVLPQMPFLTQHNSEGANNRSIVGLWHVTYTMADGTFYYESYDTWHSDGTEWESANVSPLIGNICEGVWKQTGSAIHLNHVGWGFDNSGNTIGPFTQIENVVVDGNGNSYRGTFDFKQYDMSGNLLQEIIGTITATRITAN